MSFSPSPNVQTTFSFWKIFSQRICSSHCDIFTSAALHWNIKHPSPFWPLTRCPLWEWDWIEWFLWRLTNWHQFTYFAHGLIRFQPQTDRAPTSHGIIQPLPPSSSIDLNTWQEIVYIPYHTNHIFKYSIHLRWCDIFCQLMFQQSKGAEGMLGEGAGGEGEWKCLSKSDQGVEGETFSNDNWHFLHQWYDNMCVSASKSFTSASFSFLLATSTTFTLREVVQ